MASTLLFNIFTSSASSSSSSSSADDRKRSSKILASEEAKDNHELLEMDANVDANYVIEWNDLSYNIPIKSITFQPPFCIKLKKETKVILESQSGFIKSGTITALMGPSGAGKTTLLNCLLDRFKCDNQASQLKISFVPQKDYLFKELTVRESILIAFKFNKRSCKDIDSEDKNIDDNLVVEKTAIDLNLTTCIDTKVSKLSGGQMKRLSVAVELVSSPDVLILDEPTSGLDSTNALIILKVIKNLFDSPKDGSTIKQQQPAVICSIHQPSFACLNMFNMIYLLSENGSKIYFDTPANIPSFLSSIGIKIPEICNPADYLLDASYNNKDRQVSDKIFTSTSNNIIKSNNINKIEVVNFSSKPTKLRRSKSINLVTSLNEIFLLFKRNYLILKSNPIPLIIRIIFAFLNVNTLWMYNHSPGQHDGCWNSILGDNYHDNNNNLTLIDLLRLTKDDPSNDNSQFAHKMEQVNDNVTLFLMMCNIVIYFNIMLTVAVIPMEVKIIQKEISNNWYSVNCYIITRLLFYFPLMVLQVIGYVTISYLTSSQLFEFKRLLIFILVFMYLAWISEIVGIAIGAIFAGNVTLSTIVAVLYTFPIILFGGYFVHEESANPVLNYVMWTSQVKHLLDACVIAIYGLGRCSNYDGTAVTVNELTSPKKMIERIFIDFNIDFKKSKYLAPILGVPNETCMESVINGTRDYLGLHYLSHDYEYDDIEVDIDVNIGVETSSYSYPLSLFKLKDDMLTRCFIALTIILMFYIILAILAMKYLLRQKK